MLEETVGRDVTSWSVELGEGDLALVRYTLYIDAAAPTPDASELDRKLDAMVRGWAPSVEEALIELVGAGPRDAPDADLRRRIPRPILRADQRRPKRRRTSSASTSSTTTASATRASTSRRSTASAACGSRSTAAAG